MLSREQDRHKRSLCWLGMICELVGVVEWWKMNEDQVLDGGKWGGGDRVVWMSLKFDMSGGRWIVNQCNCFRQSVLLRVGLIRTSLAKDCFLCVARNESRMLNLENGIAIIQTRENESACKGRRCVDGEERMDMPNCPDEVISWLDDGSGMFFQAEVRIKSNTEEFKSSRRKEGVCDFYGGWERQYLDGWVCRWTWFRISADSVEES